jgi:hypothetical protein
MLHHCANIILSEANRYVQSKVNNTKDLPISLAILGNSQIESKYQKGIMMRLVDITSVELRSNPNEYVPQGDGFVMRKMPEAFSLYFLFSTDYKDSDLLKNLELLAYIAAFFQHKPHFDIQNTPTLQEVGIENFSVELVKMTSSEKSVLWKSLSVPYSPSLLYKVGLVFIGDAAIGLKVTSAFLSFQK